MGKTNKNETYLILEKANTPLNTVKKEDVYILEGLFTSFDELNENQRIYQWKEFEPHFISLQNKINKNGHVLGDADTLNASKAYTDLRFGNVDFSNFYTKNDVFYKRNG